MQKVQLGTSGPRVYPIGLGCMGMSDAYGPADESESIATIHAALDAGITLLDTGDFYGMGSNEMLLRKALQGRSRQDVVLSVKFGAMRDPSNRIIGVDARPNSVRNFLAYSLRRLGTDYIDIYRPARLDPGVPIEETIGAIADLVSAGYVRFIGLSEVGVETIRRANTIHRIADLQIEYSLFSRGIESRILPACRELGIGITAYGVLSRGLLAGNWDGRREATPGDFRSRAPRFSGENLEKNLKLVDALKNVADSLGLTVAQMAIAWVLSRGRDILPVIGSRNRAQLAETLHALNAALSPEDIARIEKAVPSGAVAGDRYAAAQMAHLDSEKNN